jgi:hypothetical protein
METADSLGTQKLLAAMPKQLEDIKRQSRVRQLAGVIALLGAAAVALLINATTAVVFACLLVAAVWLFPPLRRRIVGETLWLRDSMGRRRLLIGVLNDAPVIVFFDENEEIKLHLKGKDVFSSEREDLGHSSTIISSDGATIIDHQANTGLSLSADSIALKTGDDRVLIRTGVDPGLAVFAGEDRVVLSAAVAPGLDVFAGDNRIQLRATASPGLVVSAGDVETVVAIRTDGAAIVGTNTSRGSAYLLAGENGSWLGARFGNDEFGASLTVDKCDVELVSNGTTSSLRHEQ